MMPSRKANSGTVLRLPCGSDVRCGHSIKNEDRNSRAQRLALGVHCLCAARPLSADGPRCHCGGRGCLEAYASDLATVVRYLGEDFSPDTARAIVQASGVTMADVVARSLAGDRKAIRAIEVTARHLGAGLDIIIKTFSPSQICVGGEIIGAWERIEPILTRIIRDRALTDNSAVTPVYRENDVFEARLRGATALVAAPGFAAPSVA
jgi:N-acetylglucosamine repressor